MKKDAITLTTLAARLERAIHADVGMNGLKTLLYGWRINYGVIYKHTLCVRKQNDGEPWLTLKEAKSFSEYVGYDLTKD